MRIFHANHCMNVLRSGVVVFIDTHPILIADRLNSSDFEKRPLLNSNNNNKEKILDNLDFLLRSRREFYQRSDVHLQICEKMTLLDTARTLIQKINDFVDSETIMTGERWSRLEPIKW